MKYLLPKYRNLHSRKGLTLVDDGVGDDGDVVGVVGVGVGDLVTVGPGP